MKRIGLILSMFILTVAVYAQDGKSPSELKNAGNDAYRSKKYDEALSNYEQAIATWDKETDKTMIYAAAICAYKVKNNDKALKYFNMCIAENYKTSTCILVKADVLDKQGKSEEALKVLQEGVAAYPKDAKLVGKLASAYNSEANTIFEEGQKIVNDAIAGASAGKYTTEDAQYTDALTKGKSKCKEAKKALQKTYVIDADNATAKQIEAAIDQILNL
ncbi:MAG: tetratricopeptide repeat protein [Bacteroidales bacterium]